MFAPLLGVIWFSLPCRGPEYQGRSHWLVSPTGDEQTLTGSGTYLTNLRKAARRFF
jgi:hypothetical protein